MANYTDLLNLIQQMDNEDLEREVTEANLLELLAILRTYKYCHASKVQGE